MSFLWTRRSLLSSVPAAGLALSGLPAIASPEPPRTEGSRDAEAPVGKNYPSQEVAVAKEVVSASHGRFDRVKELVSERPELANAAYDWGFGDWETALGAASHTGRRQIAAFLLESGARPDIFTAAMMGNLAAVKAFVAASPGIQSHRGPHGITLLSHAKAGGEEAAAVVAYLEALGGADPHYDNLPLAEPERRSLLGDYVFGPDTDDYFKIFLDRRDHLAIERSGGTQRVLFHQGDLEFFPSGAPSARIRFARKGKAIIALSIWNPNLVVTARRGTGS